MKPRFLILLGILLCGIGLYSWAIISAQRNDLRTSCWTNPLRQIADRIDATYSIEFTEEKLSDDNLTNSFLTKWRFDGTEIAFADYSVGIQTCSPAVHMRWENASDQTIVLKDLPSESPVSLSRGESYTERFSEPKTYLYEWNGHPAMIHVGSATRDEQVLGENERARFCKQYATHEMDVYVKDMNAEESEKFFQSHGFSMSGQDPYGILRFSVPNNFTESDVRELFSAEPRILNIEFDCSFTI